MQQPPTVVTDAPINTWRTCADGTRVHRLNIIGTDTLVYSAWVPTPSGRGLAYGHSTITHDPDGTLLGQLGTERLTPDLEALPAGPTRWHAVRAYHAANKARALAAIREAFPETTAAPAEPIVGTDIERSVPGACEQARYENWLTLPPESQRISDELAALRAARSAR